MYCKSVHDVQTNFNSCSFRIDVTASSNYMCGACQTKHTNTSAVIWCYDCDGSLCDACRVHHKSSKGTRAHDTLNIVDFNNLSSNIRHGQRCKRHNQKYELYCGKHDCRCCMKCVVNDHCACKSVFFFSKMSLGMLNPQ